MRYALRYIQLHRLQKKFPMLGPAEIAAIADNHAIVHGRYPLADELTHAARLKRGREAPVLFIWMLIYTVHLDDAAVDALLDLPFDGTLQRAFKAVVKKS